MASKSSSEREAGYQGWSNSQTWAVALHINQDQGTQSYWLEQARDLLAGNEGDQEVARQDLADLLSSEHYDASGLEEAKPDVFAQLLQFALDSVNWYEIAGELLGKVNEGA